MNSILKYNVEFKIFKIIMLVKLNELKEKFKIINFNNYKILLFIIYYYYIQCTYQILCVHISYIISLL